MSEMSRRVRGVASRARQRLGGGELHQLEERVARLERENVDLRRHSLRAAEILDVVEELLVPMASRDQDRVEEAIERFRRSL